MNKYNLVSENNESTVVSEYKPLHNQVRETSYQSESQLEQKFIEQLQSQAYEYIKINTEQDLIQNQLCDTNLLLIRIFSTLQY